MVGPSGDGANRHCFAASMAASLSAFTNGDAESGSAFNTRALVTLPSFAISTETLTVPCTVARVPFGWI